MKVDFQLRLAEGLEKLKIELGSDSCKQLEYYYTELKKWAKKVNLIARMTSDEQIIENHFLDSLMILPLLEAEESHLLDVGTGAGFPGLVCKIAKPDLEVTLVEPRLKRVSFLKHVVRSLDLQGVNTLACRVEDEEQLPSATGFSHITSRAVADIASFLALVERFSPSGARLICMKGPKWQEEVDSAAKVLQSSYELVQVYRQVLPFSSAERNLLSFRYR